MYNVKCGAMDRLLSILWVTYKSLSPQNHCRTIVGVMLIMFVTSAGVSESVTGLLILIVVLKPLKAEYSSLNQTDFHYYCGGV